MTSPDFDPTRWLNWPSVRWQAFYGAAIAAGAYVVASAALAPTILTVEMVATTLWHEGSHALIMGIFGGTVEEITIHSNGSGRAVGTATSDLHQIGVSAAGLLGEAIIGALTLYAGLTRRGLHLLFVVWGAVSLWVCHWYVKDTTSCLVLYSVGIGAVTLAYMPLHAAWKAPFMLLLAILVSIGVLRGMDYAFAIYVGDPRQLIPSDSKRIADILDTSVDVVGSVLIGLIFFIYGITAALAASFFHQNP